MDNIYSVLNGWDTDIESIRYDLENNYTKKKQTMNLESKVAENTTTLGYSGKNLLKINNSSQTITIKGIEYTVGSDKSITLTGTCESPYSDFYLLGSSSNTVPIWSGLTGSYLFTTSSSQTSKFVINFYSHSDQNIIKTCYPGNRTTIDASILNKTTWIFIRVSNQQTLSDFKIYPMLRPASITNDTYEPYKPSVDERFNNVDSNVDLLNKMISVGGRIELKTNTWFRLFDYNSTEPPESEFANSLLATFTILREFNNLNNELHQITLRGIFRNPAFVDENSYSNNFVIKKVRLVHGINNRCYIDIYYKSSTFNGISGYVTNGISSQSSIYWKAIEKPYIVDETVEGETVKTVYEFSANKSIESRIAALEEKLLNG